MTHRGLYCYLNVERYATTVRSRDPISTTEKTDGDDRSITCLIQAPSYCIHRTTSFSFSLFTLGYRIYIVYRNIGIKEQIKGEKKEVNGFGRSVRWSEELSFQANHRYIINGNTNNSVCLLAWQLWTIIWTCHFYIKIYVTIKQ